MSHVALRRVMIRMLFDPAFAAVVAADPDASGVSLDPAERAWLRTAPPAAFRADAARPARLLAALAEELPVSAALAPERVAAFFRSPEFHAAIQDRGSMALALGAHLAGDADPRVRAVAALETAIARVRRAPRRAVGGAPARLVVPPWVVLLDLPAGTLATLTGATEGGAAAVTSVDTGEVEHVVVARVPTGEEVHAQEVPDALAALLAAAATPVDRVALCDVASAHGASAVEADDILDELVADGLLVG